MIDAFYVEKLLVQEAWFEVKSTCCRIKSNWRTQTLPRHKSVQVYFNSLQARYVFKCPGMYFDHILLANICLMCCQDFDLGFRLFPSSSRNNEKKCVSRSLFTSILSRSCVEGTILLELLINSTPHQHKYIPITQVYCRYIFSRDGPLPPSPVPGSAKRGKMRTWLTRWPPPGPPGSSSSSQRWISGRRGVGVPPLLSRRSATQGG